MSTFGLVWFAWSVATAVAVEVKATCEYHLAPPPEVIRHRVIFAEPDPSLNLAEYRMIEAWVAEHGLSLVEDSQGHLNGMVFDNRDGKKDRGYLLEGRLDAEAFIIDQVWLAKKKYNHFRRLAQARQLASIEVDLGRNFLKCRTLKISGAAQIKLQMKHRLDLDEVIRFITTSRAIPKYNPDRQDRALFKMTDIDARGRRLELFLTQERRCPNELITAYVVH